MVTRMHVILAAAATLLFPVAARSLDYDPSDQVLQQALDYGVRRRSTSINSFRREWLRRVGTGANTVEFMIGSPFLEAAVASRVRA